MTTYKVLLEDDEEEEMQLNKELIEIGRAHV